MFYQDHRKYYKGYFGKLKKTSTSNSLGAQFYIYFVFYIDTTLNNCYNHFHQKSLSIRLHFFLSIHKAMYFISRV